MDLTTKFWNSKKIVSEFSESKPQEYWLKFFGNINGRKNLTVLDMGCGGGRYTEILARLGFQVAAFDLHINMVKATATRVQKATVLQAEMKKLPFKNVSFDIALSNGLFHNASSFEDFEKALSETHRVLKRNGMLCLNVFYDGGKNTSLRLLQNRVYETTDGLLMTLLSKSELLNTLNHFGFKAQGRIITYTRDMSVGKREVLRGIFKRD